MVPGPVPSCVHFGEAGGHRGCAAPSGACPAPRKVQAALSRGACAVINTGFGAAGLLFTPKGLVGMKGRSAARVHRITGRSSAPWHFPVSVISWLFMQRK